MDRDFEVGGKKFKLSKIDAFKQFHIVRRLAPLLSDLIPAMKSMGNVKSFDSLSETDKFDEIAKIASPIMTGLSKLSDQDANIVLFGLLNAVEVQHGPSWAKVASGEMLMIQDLELPILMQLAGRAFMFNLSGFFGALPQK